MTSTVNEFKGIFFSVFFPLFLSSRYFLFLILEGNISHHLTILRVFFGIGLNGWSGLGWHCSAQFYCFYLKNCVAEVTSQLLGMNNILGEGRLNKGSVG